jgi:hypothetical protein
MAVTLLSLPVGKSSLEFAPDDVHAVWQVISGLFGEVSNERHTTYARIAFGGETFLFENEWDESCLIASTEAASRLLTQIARRLSGTAS